MDKGSRQVAPRWVARLVAVTVTAASCACGTSSASTTPNKDTPAAASVVSAVTHVPADVSGAVGLPPDFLPPVLASNQPPLVNSARQPVVLFIGAEYCPFCAAERWALVVALSRFGSFANLEETRSSPWDVYPLTATFSFKDVVYSSSYLAFYGREYEGNDTTGPETHLGLERLTPYDMYLWSKYSSYFGLSSPQIPFVDIGNRMFVLHVMYDPELLAGLNQSQIAEQLRDPTSAVAQAIVGSANYLTAGICAITGMRPVDVCDQPWVAQAGVAPG